MKLYRFQDKPPSQAQCDPQGRGTRESVPEWVVSVFLGQKQPGQKVIQFRSEIKTGKCS